ncbi:glycoside hydrolase family 2 TIM barrel-domain containing protein [Pontiellaceae bacterium B12227]|nr:glycoside hydrolase family 2 TIM barrel-domain containing protein [Pontiellaceae bacterium B12227]
MKNFLIATVLLVASTASAGRETLNFNEGWSFARFGAMPDGTELAEPKGLEKASVNDSGWRILDVPHDWGIEGPFRAELPNRTGKLPWAGIGWYRKTFDAPASDAGKKVFIDFDGAMSDTKVWLNGEHVGEWPYGYSSFRLELSKHWKAGEKNTIAVRLDNKPESSRWYPGGGIYRNVRLVKTDPVHVAHWGVFVTTPVVSSDCATIRVQTEIVGPYDKVVHEIIETGKKGQGAKCHLSIDFPKRWDLDSPNLYTLRTTVFRGGKTVDEVETRFGVRTISYTAEGFFLNGKKVFMKGVCLHHDLGPLGSAINTRALERQIEILQEMGCNAIRTSHNPPAPELLELCDRMGMLVQVEAFDCWKQGKAPNDYSRHFPEWHEKDLRAMIKRDRNHPCVVMWSTGNEIREQGNKAGHLISQRLTDIAHDEDPTRLVTAGCNNSKAGFNGFEKTVDLFGYNYKAKENARYYRQFLNQRPDIPLYGSETASCVSSRGEYFFPVIDEKGKGSGGRFHVSSYDLFAPPWAYKPDVEFQALDTYPKIFGEFVWTGFDYIGEPTPYNQDKTNLLNFTDPEERKRMAEELKKLGSNIPPRSSYFGIVDLCGFKKDRFYIYQARWRPELPMAHILPHWNWPERIGKVTPVHVYTSGDEAELFLNGKSLGRKMKGEYEYRLRWDDVIYQPGELRVVAYKDGKRWAEDIVKTTGDAAQVELRADRSVISADGLDLSFITVQVSEKDGLLVPRSHNTVKFTIEGPGEIIAVGNGDPTSHESFQSLERKVFNGLALVVVRSIKGETGTIKLIAKSNGLRASEVMLESK